MKQIALSCRETVGTRANQPPRCPELERRAKLGGRMPRSHLTAFPMVRTSGGQFSLVQTESESAQGTRTTAKNVFICYCNQHQT